MLNNQNQQPKTIVFAPIAKREAVFYLRIADQIRQKDIGIDIHFISFYQPINEKILDAGFEVFDIYSHVSNRNFFCVSEYESQFGIPNMHKLILHEKVTFSEYNTDRLSQKFCMYLDGLDKYLLKLKLKYSEIDIFQELGGFVAPLSLFFASQKNNVTHYFFEPSFYKGRVHMVKDSLSPICLKNVEDGISAAESYIKQAVENKSVAIPEKDRHHFQDMSIGKIVNNRNIVNISRKMYIKYIKKQKQEYEYIFNHTTRYIYMWMNRVRMSLYYFRPSCRQKKYVYFPFHVQLDYSLTIRSTEYLDQLALVEYLARILPFDYDLYIKEHPASIGGFNSRRMKDIIRRNQSIKLIHPSENSHDVVSAADAVITINSKVGAEALASGKEVVVLGSAFYRDSDEVWKIKALSEVEKVLEEILCQKIKKNRGTNNILHSAFLSSCQMELYNNSNANIDNAVQCILRET